MGRLALLAALLVSMGVLGERGASAASLSLISGACGPGDAWRCYSTGAVELVTDLENPHAEWTIDLEFPADRENWRLIYIEAGFSGVAQYSLTYPDSSFSGRAQLARIAFDDSTDLVLAATDRVFLGFCAAGPGGTWTCSDGDSYGEVRQYGDPSYFDGLEPLPPLVGPVTLSMTWTLSGDPPESALFRADGALFGYAFAPVPEPDTALLVQLGFLALAIARRSRVQ